MSEHEPVVDGRGAGEAATANAAFKPTLCREAGISASGRGRAELADPSPLSPVDERGERLWKVAADLGTELRTHPVRAGPVISIR
jgi:hypothetical protein